MRVLVTGAAGCLARAVLPRLCTRTDVELVEGIDIRPSTFEHQKFRFRQDDMRSEESLRQNSGKDVLIHMGFAITPKSMTVTEMHANNVSGTLAVLEAATTAGVRKIINLSSVSVYGSGLNVNESAPLNPHPRFPYACHKAEIDTYVASHLPKVTTLRAHYVVGPFAQPFFRELCQSRIYIRFPKAAPTWQVVHENDVCQAIELAIDRESSSVYNLATDDSFLLDEFFRAPNKLQLPIPLGTIRGLWNCWASINKSSRDGWINTALDLIETTLTVNCERAKLSLGWSPVFTCDAIKRELLGS